MSTTFEDNLENLNEVLNKYLIEEHAEATAQPPILLDCPGPRIAAIVDQLDAQTRQGRRLIQDMFAVGNIRGLANIHSLIHETIDEAKKRLSENAGD